MIYYISDLHFRDERIFWLTNKPFRTCFEFEHYVITKWNEKVNENDLVYVVGDIGTAGDRDSYNIYSQLNGTKILIVGNHDFQDVRLIKNLEIFKKILYFTKIIDKGRKVFLCHFPVMDWLDMESPKSYHVYGHIHNKVLPEIKEYYKDKRAYNCSCDVIGFEPRTLDELIELKEKNKNESYIN